jgi:hypothetical protein
LGPSSQARFRLAQLVLSLSKDGLFLRAAHTNPTRKRGPPPHQPKRKRDPSPTIETPFFQSAISFLPDFSSLFRINSLREFHFSIHPALKIIAFLVKRHTLPPNIATLQKNDLT